MKLNSFLFGVLFTISILIVILTFKYANTARGTNAIGSEPLIILLPISVYTWRKWSIEQYRIERKNARRNRAKKYV